MPILKGNRQAHVIQSMKMARAVAEMLQRVTGDPCTVVGRSQKYFISRIDPTGKEVGDAQWRRIHKKSVPVGKRSSLEIVCRNAAHPSALTKMHGLGKRGPLHVVNAERRR